MEQLQKEERIRQYFNFYEQQILPVVAKYATQQPDGYHGLYTHTDAVVFRAIDYALELGADPEPVIFAAACHDMARKNDRNDEQHGARAVHFAQQVMDECHFPRERQKPVLNAIEHHTFGKKAPDYISACLWDADRTRLSWDRGFHPAFFNTEYAKKVAEKKPKPYLTWQNGVLGRHLDENREEIEGVSTNQQTIKKKILCAIEKWKAEGKV